MGLKPNWTQKEHETLKDMWGEFSVSAIANRLNRSVNAVKIKAVRLGLGAHLQAGTLITFCELLRAIGQDHNYSYLKMRLLRDGFPAVYKKVDTCKFLMIDIEDFWNWVEKNKDAINFAHFEKNTLGEEPPWAADKRRADIAATKYTNKPWSKLEDAILVRMLNQYKYSYSDISSRLRRTEGAVKRRINDLRLLQRPVKAMSLLWTDKDTAILQDLRHKGYGYEEIGMKLGRSALSCRGKMERLENPEYMKRCNRGKYRKENS